MKKAILAALTAVMLCGCQSSSAEPETTTDISDTLSDAPGVTQTTSAVTTAAATSTAAPTTTTTAATTEAQPSGILLGTDDIALTNTGSADGRYEYEFSYGGDKFTAVYTPDNWKIIDSYKITNEADMALICEALIAEHPVHGRDMVSYRVPEDMVYEWKLHNFAYSILPDDAAWKQNAKDVDLDPEDQDRSLYEIYRSRVDRQG